MAWTWKKTIRNLVIVLVTSAIFAIATIGLVLVNLQSKKSDQYSRGFIYLIATTFGTGIGCIWFRLVHAKWIWTHAIVHTIVVVAMLFGHRKIFDNLGNGGFRKSYVKYPLSMLALSVYMIQFILSFHFVVFRYGRTPSEKSFRYGLHAFGGALTYFICVMDGLLTCHRMAIDEGWQTKLTFHLASVSLLCFAIMTWYLLLNPYFDWRRLNILFRSRGSKVSISRSSSRVGSQGSKHRF